MEAMEKLNIYNSSSFDEFFRTKFLKNVFVLSSSLKNMLVTMFSQQCASVTPVDPTHSLIYNYRILWIHRNC